MTTFITRPMLASLTDEAKQTPRQRKHQNFHPDNVYPAHRLIVAIEPGSYVVPHCHLDSNKDETLLCLTGALGVVIFSATGEVLSTRALATDGETLGVDVPHGIYHTVLALTSGTTFFEAKAGPYRAFSQEEFAPWAPREGAPEVAAYYQSLRALFPG